MLFVCSVFGDKYNFAADSLDFSTKMGFRVRKEAFHRVRFMVSCQMKNSEIVILALSLTKSLAKF